MQYMILIQLIFCNMNNYYLILLANKYKDLEIISSLQIDYVTYFSKLPNLLACKSHIKDIFTLTYVIFVLQKINKR